MPTAKSVWLTPYLQTQQTYDALIAKALSSAAASAAQAVKNLAGKQGIGATVRAAQLTQAQTALHKVMAAMFKSIGDTVRTGQHAAAVQALSAGFSWDETLLKTVFKNAGQRAAMERALVAAAPFNVEALIIKLRGAGLPLSSQVYKTESLANGWIYKTIDNAIGRGASWNELATEVRQFIDPNTQGGVAYAAKRLARTEINNAYHAVAVDNVADKPWVDQVDWNLSKSHPAQDVCDLLAHRGPYSKTAVPAKPHPQCFCYIVPVLKSQEQFLQEFNSGLYDSYLNAHYAVAA
jgi:hypothetical protein